MPDVVGEKPYDALQDLKSASGAWQITLRDEGGRAVEVTDEFSYQFYEVDSISPEPGSVLNAADESQDVVVTLAKTRRQLEREQLIQEEINRGPFDNVTGEGCSDEGCYVEFTFTMMMDARSWEWCYDDGTEDSNVVYYQDLANRLGTSVVSSVYSMDGTLVCLYTSVRDEAGEEETNRARDRSQQILDDAKQSARDSADDLLSQLCSVIAESDTVLLQNSLSSLGASGSGEVTSATSWTTRACASPSAAASMGRPGPPSSAQTGRRGYTSARPTSSPPARTAPSSTPSSTTRATCSSATPLRQAPTIPS